MTYFHFITTSRPYHQPFLVEGKGTRNKVENPLVMNNTLLEMIKIWTFDWPPKSQDLYIILYIISLSWHSNWTLSWNLVQKDDKQLRKCDTWILINFWMSDIFLVMIYFWFDSDLYLLKYWDMDIFNSVMDSWRRKSLGFILSN